IAKKNFSQETPITNIIPSSAPAFSVLGVSPVEISKPNKWNALQAALYQNFVSEKGVGVPKDFSLEFSPYWLKDHPTFTYKDYLNKSAFTLRNLSVSLASSKVPYVNDSAQGIGLGIRLPVFTANQSRQEMSRALTSFIDSVKKRTSDWQTIFSFLIDEFSFSDKTIGQFLQTIRDSISKGSTVWRINAAEISRLCNDSLFLKFKEKTNEKFSNYSEEIKIYTDNYYSSSNYENAKSITQKIAEALKESSRLEFCAASAIVFPTSKLNYSRAYKLALWADYSFNFSGKGNFSGTFAIRYVKDFDADTVGSANNADGIIRLNFSFGNTERFLISTWGVLRYKTKKISSYSTSSGTVHVTQSDSDNKYGLDVSYKLTDNIAFSYSLGKGFRFPSFANKANALFNYLNLFYSLNTKVTQKQSDYVFKTL
ncbi:MAG TPA: TonB-dependent receptor, partial [Chitinophagaceae bacterium]|nr:TonB-dependent receptor [Chitinophagaceae bacterium]